MAKEDKTKKKKTAAAEETENDKADRKEKRTEVIQYGKDL